MKVINVLDKKKALELKAKGFSYFEQRVGEGKIVYAFIENPELAKQMSKFSKSDFYYGKTLNL